MEGVVEEVPRLIDLVLVLFLVLVQVGEVKQLAVAADVIHRTAENVNDIDRSDALEDIFQAIRLAGAERRDSCEFVFLDEALEPRQSLTDVAKSRISSGRAAASGRNRIAVVFII